PRQDGHRRRRRPRPGRRAVEAVRRDHAVGLIRGRVASSGPREPPLTLTLSPPPTPTPPAGRGDHASRLSHVVPNSHKPNPLSPPAVGGWRRGEGDRKSTRLNSSHA